MIKLSKLNGKEILLNSDQIEYIDTIPESKIMMMNGQYHLVSESLDTIVELVAEYKSQCYATEGAAVRRNMMLNKEMRSSDNRR